MMNIAISSDERTGEKKTSTYPKPKKRRRTEMEQTVDRRGKAGELIEWIENDVERFATVALVYPGCAISERDVATLKEHARRIKGNVDAVLEMYGVDVS